MTDEGTLPYCDECGGGAVHQRTCSHYDPARLITQSGGWCAPRSEDLPVLPYPSPQGPTSGFPEGVATSEERARQADTSGQTAKRQAAVLRLLERNRGHGQTWREIADHTGWHHGVVSGVLSNLHKAGKISRLTLRRSRCFVYVLPEHVHGRETQDQGRPRQPQEALALAAIQAEHKINRVREVLPDCEFTLPGMDCPGLAVGICLPCRIRRILDGHDV